MWTVICHAVLSAYTSNITHSPTSCSCLYSISNLSPCVTASEMYHLWMFHHSWSSHVWAEVKICCSDFILGFFSSPHATDQTHILAQCSPLYIYICTLLLFLKIFHLCTPPIMSTKQYTILHKPHNLSVHSHTLHRNPLQYYYMS